MLTFRDCCIPNEYAKGKPQEFRISDLGFEISYFIIKHHDLSKFKGFFRNASNFDGF